MSTIKSSSANLTLNADGSGNDIKFQSNAVEKASISDAGLFSTTTVTATGVVTGDTVADANTSNVRSGRKNMIINGGMKVWQRGTSQAAATATYNTADRWCITITAGGIWTQSKATGTAGFASAIRMDCTTADGSLAAGDRLMLSYRLEGQDLQHLKKGTASAESVTLSFWVKSPKTGTHIVELYDHDNSRHICQAYTVSSADTWEQKTLTFAGDTTGAFGDDTGKSLELQFYMAAGSNYTSGTLATSWAASSNTNRAVGQVNCADSTSNDFYLTGVQLEVGTAATDFEHRSYGEELALCQRYYQDRETTHGWVFTEYIDTFRSQTALHPTMRTAPGITFTQTNAMLYDIDGGLDISGHSISANNISDKGFRVNIASATGVETVAYANSLVWAADAEL